MPEDTLPLRFRLTPLKIILLLMANSLIAMFIVAIYPESHFPVNLVYSQCIGISIAACSIIAINYFKTPRIALQLAFIAGSVIVGAVVGMTIGGVAVYHFFPGATPALLMEKYAFNRSNLVLALLFGMVITYIFFSLQKISDEKIRRLEAEKNAVITEIKLLQSQMEPHFLFNTLSNILGLIDPDPGKAKQMLESLTLFLRASLVTARSETVALSQEMDVVKNYLDIFTVRMGERLKYRIDVPAELQGFRIPSFLIQPLVENAVKHGLEPSIRGGELVVSGMREGSLVRITVSDSGLGINELSPGSGIGVENIKKRLELVYGGRARLAFEENSPSGLKAVLEIPYEASS